jgi:UDP-N-acetylmuramyl pentapeptide phosphotransferase/UDP-N-acetylglucosamine-1-phosphate transferase
MQSFFLWFSTFIASGVTMYIVTKGCFALFQKYQIVDKPHLYPHEKHRKPLPYPGGIVLSINLVLWTPWILYAVADADIKKAAYVIIAGVLTSLVMAWDDQTRSLPPLSRLIYQLLLGAFFGVTAIKIGYMTHIFGGIIHLDQFSHLQFSLGHFTFYLLPITFTCLWYVLVMNAINWSDNGRAMTSSVGLVTCIVLALLSLKLYLTDDTIAAKNNSLFVLSFLTIFLPTLFVFWRFDVRRACIVGDAGTMFLGFMIATLAIVAGGKIATASIVLGIYFIDAFYVVLTRIRTGKNPMKGDLSHLHHRMTEKGIDHHIQRRLVMILSFIFGIGAIFLGTWGKIVLFAIMISVVLAIGRIAHMFRHILSR